MTSWSNDELHWLENNHRGLQVVDPQVLEGILYFQASFSSNKLTINPDVTLFRDENEQASYITDQYRIRIELVDNMPKMHLLDGRIDAVSKANKVDILELHVSQDGSACVASDQDLAQDVGLGLGLEGYITRYVIPFLYGQSYLERFGRWPWGELAHGVWGLLEWLGKKRDPSLADIERTLKSIERLLSDDHVRAILEKRCRYHKPCPCGSGHITEECHPHVKRGIACIRAELFAPQGRLNELKVV